MKKQRLFVDMDGTLAEWRNIIFSATIKKPEDIKKAIDKLNGILLTPGYFYSLLPHENVVKAVNNLIDTFDVYIATCAMNPDDPEGPAFEKKEWAKRYLPNIKEDHILIIPNGENKTEYIPGGIKPGDILLDDYTKNLKEWEAAGGTGVKLLNDINEKHGTWKKSAVSAEYSPEKIKESLILVGEGKKVRHSSPKKSTDVLIEIDVEKEGEIDL